ncbi:MAG TPA: CxxxxCH/CxxCH domain-containing protein [Anaeromyxobacteraceae bacterium]
MFHRLPIPLALTALLALASGCDSGRSLSASSSAASTAATCTRCHGDPASGNAAPPRSVAGLVDTALLGVGAHQAHLAAGPLRGPVACAECHVVPATVDAPGHMGKAYAAVTFGALATAGGAAASWDRVGATCTTYCHGVTLSGGTNVAPRWTQVDGTQAACGTCHGTPPGTGQHQRSEHLKPCGVCHTGYSTTSTTSVNAAVHLDGAREVGGASTSIKSWDAATRSCQPSCHGTQTW